MEKRRSPRVSLMAELTYQVEGISISKRITDLSEGGLFIDTPVPSDVGTRLKMRFLLDGQPVAAEGKVVYNQPFIGMGVEFTALEDDALGRIRDFVAQRTGCAVAAT